ncbi:ectonucleoside triphosphate diphosphohydrolase 8 isoform X2 [Cavia porcellus]|uniref:ectonucleoside triphosphate diphosphohydrolase 8 isoform X2 n=1 Tax=Cavia porcellus TaxID=10141 RepID=UPI002FE3F072
MAHTGCLGRKKTAPQDGKTTKQGGGKWALPDLPLPQAVASPVCLLPPGQHHLTLPWTNLADRTEGKVQLQGPGSPTPVCPHPQGSSEVTVRTLPPSRVGGRGSGGSWWVETKESATGSQDGWPQSCVVSCQSGRSHHVSRGDTQLGPCLPALGLVIHMGSVCILGGQAAGTCTHHGAILEGADLYGPSRGRHSLRPHCAHPYPGGGNQCPTACKDQGPGISSYTLDPSQAGESLRTCLEKALALVPRAQHRQTPVFLGATAGMRLLRQKNSSQAEDILVAVSQVLSQSPLDFWGAEVLAGQDEGAFGWITVNYLLGRLIQYSSGQWTQPAEGMLVGALDMGGASTQICFAPRGPILDQSSQAIFRLYGTNYSIYTHSHLCFGRDQALLRLLARLLQSSRTTLLRHPCYHSGYQTTLPLATLSESPCIHTAEPLDPTQNLTVEGTGNPGACVAAIRGLFNFSCQDEGDCAFNGVYQPPVQGQFYAFSGFYYTFHFLNLTSRQPLGTVNASIWDFCQRSWWQVKSSYPGQERWLPDYCASGLYILTLLRDGYGFQEETWPSIEFQQQASGTDIGWTLGYMLNLTGMIPAEVPVEWRAQSYKVWVAGVAFVVLTLAAILGAAAVHFLWLQD